MPVIVNASREVYNLPGLKSQTIAAKGDDLATLEVWKQTIDSGAGTPVHFHDCEEVIIVLTGSGELRLEDETLEFGPDSTLTVPADVVHQVVNTGETPMDIIAIFPTTSVNVFDPKGNVIPLPWIK